MKKVCVASACALVLASVAVGDTAVWLETGTGGWASPERWKDGKVPVPSVASPWTVTIPDCANAVVTDADKEYFEALGKLNINSNAVLTVTNDADLALSCPLTGGIEMKVVKLGSGTLTLRYTQTKYQFNTEKTGSRWLIRDGVLAVDSCETSGVMEFRCPVGVWSPGVLRLDSKTTVQLRGLYGDGKVEIPAPVETVTFAANNGADNDFSGVFDAGNSSFYITVNGGHQKISNLDTAAALYKPRFMGSGTSRLALASFPDSAMSVRAGAEIEYMGSADQIAGVISFQNNGYHLKFNAGENGGTRFTTELNPQTGKMSIIEFTGDNATASVYNGSLGMSKSECALYIKKTGSGTWRLASTRSDNHGTIAVEQGTLEFETVKERGEGCSLGTANLTHSEYTGAKDDNKAVPYACLVGCGNDEACPVLCYVGSVSAVIANRAVAIKGIGGFASNGGTLDWTGFTSAQSGMNTLVLSGTAEGCIARSVTNGVGTVAVTKVGSGTWTLDGDVDFAGGVNVKEGMLSLGLDADDSDARKMSEVSSVSVAEGATLVSDKQVPVGAIVFDASEGAGTIDGFSFPETGHLEIKGKGTDLELAGSVAIPYEFKNCKNAANISKWTLSMDGEDVKADEFLITVGASGIEAKYLPPGFQIIIR